MLKLDTNYGFQMEFNLEVLYGQYLFML